MREYTLPREFAGCFFGIVCTASEAICYSVRSTRPRYLGCAPAACLPVARWASPIDYVDAKDPPFLIFHGDIDKTVPVAQSQTFSEALTKAGVKTELVVVPGMDHSFITADGKPSPETNKMALDKMAVFIDQTIGAKR